MPQCITSFDIAFDIRVNVNKSKEQSRFVDFTCRASGSQWKI